MSTKYIMEFEEGHIPDKWFYTGDYETEEEAKLNFKKLILSMKCHNVTRTRLRIRRITTKVTSKIIKITKLIKGD